MHIVVSTSLCYISSLVGQLTTLQCMLCYVMVLYRGGGKMYRGGRVGMVWYVHEKNKPRLLHLAISIMGHGARKFMH